MRRRAATSVFLATFLCAAASRAETLNLLIWEAYIDQGLIDRWTQETGIAIRQINFDSDDARDEILADPSNNVDLVVVDENGAHLFGKKGVLEPLEEANLPALKDYEPKWRDRCAGRGLPYFSGTVGILYRSDIIAQAPTSWEDMMRPSVSLKKHIAMFDDHTELFVPPLMLLGASINASETGTLKAAFDLLKAQAPAVLTYDYVITAIQDQATGKEIYMALGYSGDQHVLNDKVGTPGLWRYSVPKEGTLSWLDCVSVMASSPRKQRALEFLDFIGSPEGAAANALALTMPTTSSAALKILPEAMRSDPEIYPPAATLAKSQYQQELSIPSVQARRRIISTLANFQ
ncbi:polyamine ABC transporter substrate-binding protein [Sinorhizobium americanum]|uniref:Spermidine/putrescine ABC transporter periplasmic spermidine/putrescine-binding protein n=1 Tax=Sinorhizobium americanum TaxID=194963 RepID=A0A1L3LJM4_9HYPH|nr:spermidine/putrescine ABC transporter substrate-binding protein [Sinorhizobium americanum]APG90223.1 spermidine/putrescine ABC transporter periplasmic spermidine/putrescine-binding protein [Sinorhizobium americanum]OAP49731.1 spermidine/putrescine ABC transporter substrate-binding protein [Sinorhizobium americanum]